MSAAEIRINDMCKSIYSDYNFDSMSSSDKQYFLVVFSNMLGENLNEEDDTVCTLPKYTVQELRERSEQGWKEYREGKCRSIDELFDEFAKDYPWAFK